MQVMKCKEFCDCPHFFITGLQACIRQCITHVGNFLCEEFAFVEVNFDNSFSASLQVCSQVLVVVIEGLVLVVSKSFNQSVILNNADFIFSLELFDHFCLKCLADWCDIHGQSFVLIITLGHSKGSQFSCLVIYLAMPESASDGNLCMMDLKLGT